MSLLEQHYLTKIEGHGTLNISFRECKASLQIKEGERLFEALLLGRPFTDGPFITSRICGICPVAHTLASLKALENALGIEVDENTIKLRKILLAAQIINSHVLHLFFLALPDYLGLSSVLELSRTRPQLFAQAQSLKKLSDEIITIIGGRNIHPITAVVGGFTTLPTRKQLQFLKKEAKNNLLLAEQTVKLFSGFKYPQINQETQYLCLVNGQEYEIYDGKVETSNNYIFDPQDYKKEIKETIKPHSPAKYATHYQQSLLVGALARISLHQEYLQPRAKKALQQSKIEFPNFNTFYNNLSQAVEILHFMEEIIKLCNELLQEKSYKLQVTSYKIKAGSGVGAIEAPRGTLYHYYEIDKNGLIRNCDIVTPTVQNLTNLEEDAKALLKTYNLDKQSQKVCIRELEMLIRAYDPCITCSVH